MTRKPPERGAIHTPEYEAFLTVLRAAREEAKVTQEELARRLQKSQSFVTKAETGDRRLDVAQVLFICRALGISLQAFIQEYEAEVTKPQSSPSKES